MKRLFVMLLLAAGMAATSNAQSISTARFQKGDNMDWAKADVDRLSAAGLVKGYGDGTLGAADQLTVEQVGILMERLSGLL